MQRQDPDDSYPYGQRVTRESCGSRSLGRVAHLVQVLPNALPQPLQVHGRAARDSGRAPSAVPACVFLPAARWVPPDPNLEPRLPRYPGNLARGRAAGARALPLPPDPAPEVLRKCVVSGARDGSRAVGSDALT